MKKTVILAKFWHVSGNDVLVGLSHFFSIPEEAIAPLRKILNSDKFRKKYKAGNDEFFQLIDWIDIDLGEVAKKYYENNNILSDE